MQLILPNTHVKCEICPAPPGGISHLACHMCVAGRGYLAQDQQQQGGGRVLLVAEQERPAGVWIRGLWW